MLFTCCHSKILVLAARGRQSMAPVSWQHASHGFGRVAWFYNSRQPFCTSCDDICASWSKKVFDRFSVFAFEEMCKISLAAEGRRESQSLKTNNASGGLWEAIDGRVAVWAGDGNAEINSILNEWRRELSDSCRKKMQKTLEHNVEHLFQLRGCCPSVPGRCAKNCRLRCKATWWAVSSPLFFFFTRWPFLEIDFYSKRSSKNVEPTSGTINHAPSAID